MKKQTEDYRVMPIIHQRVAGIGISPQFYVATVGDDPKRHV